MTDGDEPHTTMPPTASPTAAPTPAEAGVAVSVEVENGAVVGGMQRVPVALGDDVIIQVTSDVADEVHVHGYDEKKDVEAGGTVAIEFVAAVPGVFVVELEERQLHILELEVR